MKRLLLLCLMPLLTAGTLRAEEPFSLEKTPGKLPKDVVPRHYVIRVEPRLSEATFSGSETIEIEVLKPASRIVLNALNLDVSKATLVSTQKTTPLTIALNAEEQTLSLTAPEPLSPGLHKIELTFSGTLHERPQGLYFTRYQSGSEEKRALSSQMEATDARRMFPCWDEPAFRATFQLTAAVPEALTPVSNMPIEAERSLGDGRKEVRFGATPAMASYLVFFAAAELEELRGEIDGVQLRVLTTPGKREQGRYALEATKLILPFYHAYFGVSYPLPKLDQVAFVNTGASGMENWGAILYDETALLFDPATGSQASRERVFEVVAHEIAHQWFGDLITMAWWDNLWLNEGFASWMGTKATAHFNPDWKPWLRAAASKEHAMHLDARSTTHPIQQHIATESEADDAFDEITYSKGQAFLRMLESWLSEETFRDGIRLYFQRHAYSNTTTADLWAALEEISHQPVRAMAAGWTEQPGFPLVRVSGAPGGLRLSQETFTVHQKNPVARLWKIPVVLQTLGAKDPARRFLLESETADIELAITPEPFKANSGDVGYFRVVYEDALFGQILEKAAGWPEADRLNLLNDTWALVQAERTPLSRYLDLSQRLLPGETSYAVLAQILDTFAFLDALARDPSDATLVSTPRVRFRTWARARIAPHLARIGWEGDSHEDPLTGLLRKGLVSTLGALGDPAVLAQARERFEKSLAAPATLTGDLRNAVLAVVGAAPEESTWEQLHTLLKKERSTELQRTLQHAMASSPRPGDAAKTLQLSLGDELVPSDAAYLVQHVARRQPALAWAFAREHLPALQAKVASLSTNNYVPGIFSAFQEVERAEELETFAKANLPAGSQHSVAKTADEIRFKAALQARVLPALDQWLSTHARLP